MTEFRPSRFRILPDVVKNLLIINGLLFLATEVLRSAFGLDLVGLLGLHYFGSAGFRPHQLVTHLFMHGSVMHLFSNMFALWMFGSVLENNWGTKRFLVYYLATGLGAALLHSLITAYNMAGLEQAVNLYVTDPSLENFALFVSDHGSGDLQLTRLLHAWQSAPFEPGFLKTSVHWAGQYLEAVGNIPTVGASGAVFGVLLAFGMMFPNTYIFLYFFFPIKAKYFVILYAAFELWAGIQGMPGDNIAHYAHLGGMLFGYLLIKWWDRGRRGFY